MRRIIVHRCTSLATVLFVMALSGCGDDGPVPEDAGSVDARVGFDATSDGPVRDAAAADAAAPDAAVADAAVADAAVADAAPALDASGPEPRPPPPPTLSRWVVGSDADADVTPTGPGLILAGGGPDVDAAFLWQRGLVAGGDVVVLRTSGSDGYNDYLYHDIGGIDSVETLLVDTRALANDPYVDWTLRRAEAIFLAGGDQSTYIASWANTRVSSLVTRAWMRGAVIGGTSAGLAVMGEQIFSATNGSVTSDEALTDPYNLYMTIAEAFVGLPPLQGFITDSHFRERDRMGRLLAFVARPVADGTIGALRGLGIDESTALLVDASGDAQVVGAGAVYLVAPTMPATSCVAGLPLYYPAVPVHKLQPGDSLQLPAGVTSAPAVSVTAAGGLLMPADPY